MANVFSTDNANSYLEELQSTDADSARLYLLNYGYSSSSFEMPEYYGATGLENIALKSIDWLKKEKPLITQPLNFLTPKGNLSWRSFNLLHPYIYVHIVNEMTSEQSWDEIRERLCCQTLVNCYSIPKLNKKDEESTKVSGITRWLQMAENDLVKDSVHYSFLTVTDIKNFYPSIYTHSISWAIHGKEVAKNNRFDMSFLGNKLDKLFQNARDGQTNGIPVGSMVSDIVAEIILKDMDAKLSEIITQEELEDEVLISRYRDDYRILSKTNEQGRFILKSLSRVLDEYNLVLNAEKTKVYEDIIEGSFRDWSREISNDYLLRSVKYGELQSTVTASLLKDVLLKIYQLQKQYPEGRSSITLLSKLTEHLNKEDVFLEVDKIDIHTTISILRKLALVREEVSAQTYLLLDILLKKLDDEDIKANIIEELLDVIRNEKDHDYQVIWLFRLCLSNAVTTCEKIYKDTKSSLIELLKEEYRNIPFYYGYEIFPKIKDLGDEDVEQLRKFNYVDDDVFQAAVDAAIDREFYDIFKY